MIQLSENDLLNAAGVANPHLRNAVRHLLTASGDAEAESVTKALESLSRYQQESACDLILAWDQGEVRIDCIGREGESCAIEQAEDALHDAVRNGLGGDAPGAAVARLNQLKVG